MKLKELLSILNDKSTVDFEIEEEIYPTRMLVKDIQEVYSHALDYKVTTVDAAVSYIHCSDGEPAIYIEVSNFVPADIPSFAVGEYYSYSDSNDSCIFKVTKINDPYYETLEFSLGLNQLTKDKFHFDSNFTRESKPATAEQIATFKRAKQFATKGRKLDEFRVGDLVKDDYNQEHKIIEVDVWGVDKVVSINIGGNNAHINAKQFTLIQTAEELQEVETNENI